MAEQPAPERGAAEEASGVPVTPTEEAASRRPPSEPGGEDADRTGQREAEEAHGGSMAPGLVDETGNPVAEPPPSGPAGEDR